jgi:pyridoxal phosphate enzyme (YggS family)
MMSISTSIGLIKRQLPQGVRLVAVSKYKSIETILEAYSCGQKIFGENKVQELANKAIHLPNDIEWHFIGHLQTNKVRQLLPHVSLIQSVDSFRLLQEINKEAAKIGKTIRCLLQFHIAEEETKFGLSLPEADLIFSSDEFHKLQNISINGVMGMATFTEDEAQIRKEFSQLQHIFHDLKNRYFSNESDFMEISMGMSDDYQIALEYGSTLVRIGTAIFGSR